jgi:hypothetical protein
MILFGEIFYSSFLVHAASLSSAPPPLVMPLPLVPQLPLVVQPPPVASAFASCCTSLSMLPSCSLVLLFRLCLVALPPLVVLLTSSASCCDVASCRLPLTGSTSHPLAGCCTIISQTISTSSPAPLVILIILFTLAWRFQRHHQPKSPPWCFWPFATPQPLEHAEPAAWSSLRCLPPNHPHPTATALRYNLRNPDGGPGWSGCPA